MFLHQTSTVEETEVTPFLTIEGKSQDDRLNTIQMNKFEIQVTLFIFCLALS